MMKIALIRHGITEWNIEGRIQGHIDIALNEEGRRQARALAERLKDQRWDLLISSDLSRAVETAEAILHRKEMPFKKDARLRERSYGRIEGLTIEEREKMWGKDWRKLDHGIESEQKLRKRALDVWEEIIRKYEYQNVLIVTHGGFISQLLKALLPSHPAPSPIHNTSISLLQQQEDRWICDPYNCVAHLDHPDFISR